jgi:1,5-anhydro-D-fructose reductase (1,5-anhydro-D-mannitol-forming)
MKKNGWGLIGTGRIAEDRVLPAIKAHAGNRLIGVVSRDPQRAQRFADKFDAEHAYTSFDEMLRNPEVTVVAIHTPNAQHAEQAIAAARAGKHVFCDKPMAIDVADAEKMVRECEKAGVKLGINFHNRFMPCFAEIRRVIGSGEIGEVHLVQLEVSPGARSGGRLATWRIDPALAGLGTTYSIGVHAYDILRYLIAAEVEMVSALFDQPRGVMEEMNVSLLRFVNGALAQLSVHENSPLPHNDIVIYGSKGRITGRGITRSRDGGVLEVMTEAGRARRMDFPAINAHGACVMAFSDALLDGRDFVPSGIDGLRSVQITDAMARSAHGGVHVRLAY